MPATHLQFALWIATCALVGCGADDAVADAADASGSTGRGSGTTTGQGSDVADGTAAADASDAADGSGSTSAVGSGAGSSTTSDCTPAGDTAQSAELTLTTSDGKEIAAVLTAPDVGTCLSAVVLVHQFGLTQAQWSQHLAAFAERGVITLTIDLRGHGASDPADGALTELLTDPAQAPLDVEAAVDHLKAHRAVDAERIGVVGTSIGANLALVAATQFDLAVAVAISARATPVESLLGGESVSVGPLLCFAGANDGGGDQAASCAAFEAQSSGPAQSVILPDTAAHGVEIVDSFPDTIPTILEFLDANL